MNKITIIEDELSVSRLALGMMRIADLDIDQVTKLIDTALEVGINFFDHADIYGGGKSEELFGEYLKNNQDLRSKMIIQSKCGIRKGQYDFSKEHIINSVNQSLKRLNTDYLDILLLHRPDALCDPIEVSDAINQLYNEKKIKYFGVSNHNPYQIQLLQKHLKVPILFNQVQFSLVHASLIDSGINVNMSNDAAIDKDGSLLDFCRLNNITIQPWSVLQASWEDGCFIDHPKYENLNIELANISSKYNVSKAVIAIAWILRHPANMQPIIGTTNPERLKEINKSLNINLTREEWYKLYLANNRQLP